FAGRMGKVRFWHSFLRDDYPAKLMGRPEVASFQEFYPFLVLSSAPAAQGFDLFENPAHHRPRAGWWRQVGMSDTRIHNLDAAASGLEQPSFSPLHQALRKDAGSMRTAAERAAFRQVEGLGFGEDHPHFSIHPTFKIELDEGIDPRSYAPVAADGVRLEPERVVSMRGASAFKMSWDENDQLGSIYLIECGLFEALGERSRPHATVGIDSDRFDGDQPEARAQCAKSRAERDRSWIWLAEDEEIRGLSYRHAKAGGIVGIYVHTTRSTLGPFVDQLIRQGKVSTEDPLQHIYLDAGVPFGGITAAGRAGFVEGLGFYAMQGIEISGLTLYAESGQALRFYQTEPDLFHAIDYRQTIAPHGHPTIRVDGDDRIRISGIDPTPYRGNQTRPVTFERLADKPPVTPYDTYNNTFVSLSKAVNLQANYYGYDILEMDPIQLVKTGTARPIFREPKGETRNYYDANRIFVPRGLTYVPEFTGEIHKTVDDTTSYAEFKDAASKSVNAGLESKALPSFSLSNTMSEARETISENKMSKSLGLTKAMFYDLVLEKSEIALSEAFIEHVGMLARHGDYASFIDDFGTHYPVAVVYGGMGVLDIEMNERMRTSLLQNGVDTKTEINLLIDPDSETGIKIGSENQNESSRLFRSITGSQSENFYWIGGTHSGTTSESWSVGTDGVVPVHVTLRPIDELLTPLFFADKDITVRVRRGLKSAITRYMVENSDLVNGLRQVPKQGFVEIRMDNLFCGTPPVIDTVASNFWRDKNTGDMSARPANARPKVATVYPMLHFTAYDAFGRQLINFGGTDSDEAEKHEPLQVICNTRNDIIAKSPYLQSTKVGRFALSVDHVLDGAVIQVVDQRSIEHHAIYPPLHFDKKDQVIDAIEVGATLGLKALWDEYVGDGSLTVKGLNKDDEKPPPAPEDMPPHNLLAYALFCETPDVSPCPSVSKQSIIERVGIWQRHRITLLPPPAKCDYCVPHVLEYSVRYIQ
ncbi:MAC/perforin domain-containing protein, partial [Thiocapsa sp.]|uniref:MAC/perforin domain-containing protein n=1 Tax=Thiocapsa sp. TaxID=2024551 RepID=UPI0025F3FC46